MREVVGLRERLTMVRREILWFVNEDREEDTGLIYAGNLDSHCMSFLFLFLLLLYAFHPFQSGWNRVALSEG